MLRGLFLASFLYFFFFSFLCKYVFILMLKIKIIKKGDNFKGIRKNLNLKESVVDTLDPQ